MRKLVFPLSILLLAATMLFADDPVHDRITIDTKRPNWEPMVLATLPEPPADNVTMDLTGDHPVFTSREANANGVFEYRLHAPIDTARYPFLVMKYRAKNLNTTHVKPGIWLDDLGGKASAAMKDTVNLDQFIADGEVYELKKDLREIQPRGTIVRFILGLMATDQGEASLELIELNFAADPTAAPVEPKDDSAVAITVLDGEGKPLKGAKVALDIERKDIGKSGETDDKGEVTLTPRETETGEHSLQVEAEGMATYYATIAKGAPGTNVNMTKGASYGGIVKNEDGQPVEGATVRIFAPAPPSGPPPYEARMIRRAIMKTDAEGKWKSPVLPEGDAQVITKLAHPDYIPDKEYRQAADEPSVEEMKAGTGVMILKK